MKPIYEVGVLVSSVVTTAVITRVVTKKEDEQKFLQFKQNMEELKKENLKLKERCSDVEDEIEDLEKEVTKAKNNYNRKVEENQKIIDYFDQYQTASINVFDTIVKPVTNVINEEYLSVADDVIHSSNSKELAKSVRKLARTEFIVEEAVNLNIPQNSIESLFQSNESDDDDDEYDEDNEVDIIDRMDLNNIMTAKQYQDICNRIEELESEENAFSYKSILDNILEYIFIKRQLCNNSSHSNELYDLKFISNLNVDESTLDNIEEYYDNMRFCIVNINDIYKELEKYRTLRNNDVLNKIKFFNNSSVQLIPDILCKTDKIENNGDRINIIMTISNILRRIKEISETGENVEYIKTMIDDIVSLNSLSLSKEKIKEYVMSEYDAIEDYNVKVEEYLENVVNNNEGEE